jgi:hypothetical protein
MQNDLIKYIHSSPLVHAAITEAVHRFYYDRILSDKEHIQRQLIDCNVSETLSTLWNLYPDWRHTLANSAKRYMDAGKVTSLPVISRPKKMVKLNFNIEIENPCKKDNT